MGITEATAAVEPDDLAILSDAQMLALLPSVPTAEEMNSKLPIEFAQRLRPPDPVVATAGEALAFQNQLRDKLRGMIDAPMPEGFSPSVTTATQFVEGDIDVSILHFKTEVEIVVPALYLTRRARAARARWSCWPDRRARA
ncbi:hypothetical protein HS125_09310 [bacterium]|nr:hypothetical protein [bacterium]